MKRSISSLLVVPPVVVEDERVWEEDPEYQKAQAKTVGVLVGFVFVAAFLNRLTLEGWLGAMWVFGYFLTFLVALALLPLTAWMVICAVKRLRTMWRRRCTNGNV